MSHFKITTFFATTATAMAPFLAVYYLPQQKLQAPASSTLAALPKPRPLAALREAREQAQAGPEFNLL